MNPGGGEGLEGGPPPGRHTLKMSYRKEPPLQSVDSLVFVRAVTLSFQSQSGSIWPSVKVAPRMTGKKKYKNAIWSSIFSEDTVAEVGFFQVENIIEFKSDSRVMWHGALRAQLYE